MQNFSKLAQLEIPKNRGELYNDVNISKSKKWKNNENSGIFTKFEKPNILVLWNFIRKAHAKFQKVSSMGSMQISRELMRGGHLLSFDKRFALNACWTRRQNHHAVTS